MPRSKNLKQKPKDKWLVCLFARIVDICDQFLKKEGRELRALTAKFASKFFVAFFS